MRSLINAAFAFTLVGFATGVIQPIHDPRFDRMRAELTPFHWSSHWGIPLMRGPYGR